MPEAARWDPKAWDAALSIVNQGRERLTEGFEGLLVLAGPPQLQPMVLERPDLGSMLGPVLRLSGLRSSTAPAKLRWLHLSDLHFSSDERWERRTVLQSLLRLCKDELVAKGLGPHLVLVTGDVASSGKPVEYEQAEAFFHELMDTLGLKARDHLFIVPGNHDVDRGRIGPTAPLISSALLEAEDQGKVEEILGDAPSLSLLGARLESFYAFTRRLLGG